MDVFSEVMEKDEWKVWDLLPERARSAVVVVVVVLLLLGWWRRGRGAFCFGSSIHNLKFIS